MAETVFRGPAYSAGSMIDGRVEPMDGPGLEYQANGFPDVRFTPTRKDGLYPGRVRSILNSPFFVCCDNVPQQAATAGLVTSGALSSVNMTLVATQSNGATAGLPTASPGVSIIRSDTGALVTGLTALDFGFTSGTTTTGGTSTTITVPDSTLFYVGQWIAVGGAGNSGKTLPLYTQVLALASATTITVSLGAQAAITNAPIGNTIPQGPLLPVGTSPNAVFPFLSGGLGIFLNPPEAIARIASITGNAGSTAQNFTVRGYDIYHFPMTEVIAFAGGAVTTFGKKAFKYIASITAASTDAGHNLSAGFGDTFGFHVRTDKWEYVNTFFGGSFATSSSGWLTADKTNPATGTTGDVRGTVQAGALGAGSTPAAPLNVGTDGTRRLMMAMTVPLYNNIFGTPVNPVPMYGQTQFAG